MFTKVRAIGVAGAIAATTLLTAGVAGATVGFGVAHWHLLEGRRPAAKRALRELVAAGLRPGGSWSAFGSIAAEAELARWTP